MVQTSTNRGMVLIFSIVLTSMIIIFSQFQIAFAGLPLDSDYDGDGFTPNEGDCDDNNPNKYPGRGCAVPVQEINLLIEDVNDLAEDGTINEGQANALLTKLENAIDKIESNNIKAAIGSLKAFINQINAYINSGVIQPNIGNQLINDVQIIIETLKMG